VKKIMLVLLALAAVSVAATAGAATKKPIAFVGKYAGNATTQANDNVVTINAKGTGKGNVVGAGAVTGKGTADSSQRPCVPFAGTGTITGPGGVITFKMNPSSVGCGDQDGQVFSIQAKAAVLKGTKKFAKYSGILKVTGTFDRSSGDFSVKFSGTLK
jgi:hypothetical protein